MQWTALQASLYANTWREELMEGQMDAWKVRKKEIVLFLLLDFLLFINMFKF